MIETYVRPCYQRILVDPVARALRQAVALMLQAFAQPQANLWRVMLARAHPGIATLQPAGLEHLVEDIAMALER